MNLNQTPELHVESLRGNRWDTQRSESTIRAVGKKDIAFVCPGEEGTYPGEAERHSRSHRSFGDQGKRTISLLSALVLLLSLSTLSDEML